MSRLSEAASTAFTRLTGRAIVPEETIVEHEEFVQEVGYYRDEVEAFVDDVIEYLPGSGRSYEMQQDVRRRITRQGRKVIQQDPVAGGEIDLRTNFAYGRGVSKPKATDERVQKIIDEAWDDPVNQAVLTGYDAQRANSYELWVAANLFLVSFENNGYVRLGMLDEEQVTDIVTDPDNDLRPLWYVVRRTEQKWDFTTHSTKVDVSAQKTWYYEHWRNVEDAKKDAERYGVTLEGPDPDKIGPGKVYHARINHTPKQQFGVPPLARTIRFYTALNRFTESRVVMSQAAAQFIARRTVQGTPNDLLKQAGKLMNHTGELGTKGLRTALSPPSHNFGDGVNSGRQPPVPPGSMLLENQAVKTESLALNSGAQQAAQDAQLIRAPLSAASQFHQGYLGDASNAGSLASATALELPAMMAVGAWQEYGEQMFRWFIDSVIDAAVKAGRLGEPTLAELGDVPLSELRLHENRAEMQGRMKIDLSYEFQMPYPGRRMLPDIVTAIVNIADAFDPNGENIPLRRALLTDFYTMGFERENPSELVNEIIPEDAAPTGPSNNLGGGGPGAPTGGQNPADMKSVNGEKRTATPPDKLPMQQAVGDPPPDAFGVGGYLPPEVKALVDAHTAEIDNDFQTLVSGPAEVLAQVAGSQNGDGHGHGGSTT